MIGATSALHIHRNSVHLTFLFRKDLNLRKYRICKRTFQPQLKEKLETLLRIAIRFFIITIILTNRKTRFLQALFADIHIIFFIIIGASNKTKNCNSKEQT